MLTGVNWEVGSQWGGSVLASYGDKCSLLVSAYGDSNPSPRSVPLGIAATAILSTGDYRDRHVPLLFACR